MSVTSDMFSVGYITGEEWQTIQYRTHEEFDPHRRGTWKAFAPRSSSARSDPLAERNQSIKGSTGHQFWWKSLSRGENTFEELPAIDEYESDRFLLSYGGRSRRDPSNDHAILRFQELESFALSHGEGSNGLWYKAYKAIGKDMLGFTDDREEADSGTFTYLPLTYPHFYRSARPSESILPSEVGVSPATGVPVTWGADVIDNEQTEHTVYPVEGTRPPGWTGTEEDLDTQV
ncbi:hypothetical protein I204_06777 [Kwoniella mangroviensis CBS 8886]|nr:hypothetical protein I204_06777 [Kwoniella mangroviensis CBS 8886]